MFQLIWLLIIGVMIGALAGVLAKRNTLLGWSVNMLAGLVGAWLGETLFGSWGPQVADLALLPAIAGAIILVVAVSWLLARGQRK